MNKRPPVLLLSTLPIDVDQRYESNLYYNLNYCGLDGTKEAAQQIRPLPDHEPWTRSSVKPCGICQRD